MLGYLSADIICSSKLAVFFQLRSRKTARFSEQIMSKDKYPSIFSPQLKAIVFIIPQISLVTRAVLKIRECSLMFLSFSWEIFGHVTCLDQSRASENIWSNYKARPTANRLTMACSLVLKLIYLILNIPLIVSWHMSRRGIRWPVSRC